MANLTPQGISNLGTAITFVAASAGGDRVPVGTDVYLIVKNGSGSSINVTLDTTGVAFNTVAIPDTVVAVAAGTQKIIPISEHYRASSDARAAIAYSAVTTVEVAALRIS